ncbi:MAG: hypothetical protein RL077_739 [Verrucomicrobiota bacterium]
MRRWNVLSSKRCSLSVRTQLAVLGLAGLASLSLPAADAPALSARDFPPVDRVSGPPPGTVIFASPDPGRISCASPSIALLPDGSYLVSNDTGGRTLVHVSTDRGATWRQIAELTDQKWSTLFLHRDALHLIGTTAKAGHMIVRRSTDGGHTWTNPADARHGLLAEGKYHCAPTPVVVHGGRVWRAFEQFSATPPVRTFKAFMMSAPEDADLLDAAGWTRTNSLTFQRAWLNTRNEEWLEGNAVVTPAGALVNVLRVEAHPAIGAPFALPGTAAKIPRFEVAAMMEISRDGRTATFDPARGFLQFIGSEAKFTIRYDAVSKRYWSIGSKITNPHTGYAWLYTPHHQRNVLALTSSADLHQWEEHCRLLRFREGQVVTKAESRVGFQYVDWQFDGDDLIAVCRTAWGSANYHDANFITFHRVKNFRSLTMADSPPPLDR